MAMTDQKLEQVSALVDSELSDPLASGLLDRIGRDPELRATWERYHLIAQAVRGEPITPAARRLASSIGEALRHEPTPLRRVSGRRRHPSRLVPFAGAALAAGAAFLAVFAVPNLLQGPDTMTPQPLQRPVASATPAVGVAERRWQLDRPDLANKLDLFLVNHQEAAPAAGVKGMLPYATLVGYESAR
jgi:sigma-E factor negative regulatory protein RseA